MIWNFGKALLLPVATSKWRYLLLTIMVFAGACTGVGDLGIETVVRDSSGVVIIENPAGDSSSLPWFGDTITGLIVDRTTGEGRKCLALSDKPSDSTVATWSPLTP